MNDARTFCCSKSGEELFQVVQSLHSLVSSGVIERKRTTNGLRLRINRSPDADARLREFVRREMECCPFFEFNLTERQSELSLEIVGPEGSSALLDLLFQLSQPPNP